MDGRHIGWLLLSLFVVLATIAASVRVIRRAIPHGERTDFERAGNVGRWSVDSLAALPGPVGAWVRELAQAPDQASRIDSICEQLAEVDARTAQLSEYLGKVVRTALASGTLISIAMLSSALARADRLDCIWALAPALACGASGFLCSWMGRVASANVASRRRAWDALCQMLIPPHMSWPRAGQRHRTAAGTSRNRK